MFSYTPQFIPNKVLVVGCGGTGSRLIPLIAQFIKTCAWVLNPEMVIVDDDEVEEKNLRRQNFVSLDVGKKKAQVIAQRYSKAYNINIVPITERIHNLDERDSKYGSHSNVFDSKIREWARAKDPVLAILCVDSAEARRHILRALSARLGNSSQVLLIDTGNENDFGQVKIGGLNTFTTYKAYVRELNEVPNAVPVVGTLNSLPLDVDYYSEMESSAAPSCADLDQTMAINSLVANITFGMIQNWYFAKPITTHKVNISLSHGCIPEYMTAKYIAKMVDAHSRLFKGDLPNLGISGSITSEDVSRPLNTYLGQVHSHVEAMDKLAREEAEKLAKAEAELVAAAAKLAADDAKDQELVNQIEAEVNLALSSETPKAKKPRKPKAEKVEEDNMAYVSVVPDGSELTAHPAGI